MAAKVASAVGTHHGVFCLFMLCKQRRGRTATTFLLR
jgi:hypothetical protein